MNDVTRIVYGKNDLKGIVGCEMYNGHIELYIETPDGIETIVKPAYYWILMDSEYGPGCDELEGNQHFKYIKKFPTKDNFMDARKWFMSRDRSTNFSIFDPKEASMVYYGFTYFKGMTVNDVSVLSFDIETTGITHDKNSKVLLISNAYRKNGKVVKKLFAYDEYDSQADMIEAWDNWVREVNPSIIMGHNVYGFDFPYIDYVARREGYRVKLGRSDRKMTFDTKPSKFRKDGSQFYEYHKCIIHGREIVDTMFLSYKYDVGRKYTSYNLKNIIRQEGLEREGRQFYDAGKIKDTYKDPKEWIKIKEYAIDDAIDALKLYDLMAPAFFYMTQSIPKPYQTVMTSASGSQLNGILIRSYLQDGYSIPKATETGEFQGAISFGKPGVYKNLIKSDVASLYPSIMLEYKISDANKDPKHNFTKILEYFREERLKNKHLAKETGDKYYDDLQSGQKTVINSLYGFMGAPGLNFNSPKNAALVTKYGREVLEKSMKWAEDKGFIVPGGDTDSILYGRPDGSAFTEGEIESLLDDLNSNYPDNIKFEEDGYFPSVVILKAKNYVLYDGKKVKIKGSALKATMKEVALREFLEKSLKYLLHDQGDRLKGLYDEYAIEIMSLTTMDRWASKKTVTESILNPKRANESKVLEAIGNKPVQEGDKIFTFFTEDGNISLMENFNGDYCKDTLLDKLFKTLKVLSSVIRVTDFPNYSLKRNKKLLKELMEGGTI